MIAIERLFRKVRLYMLTVALHDADAVGNKQAAYRLAPEEARLRAELWSL